MICVDLAVSSCMNIDIYVVSHIGMRESLYENVQHIHSVRKSGSQTLKQASRD